MSDGYIEYSNPEFSEVFGGRKIKCNLEMNFCDEIYYGQGIGKDEKEAQEFAEENAARQIFENAIPNANKDFVPKWFDIAFQLIITAFEIDRVVSQYSSEENPVCPDSEKFKLHPHGQDGLFGYYWIPYFKGMRRAVYLNLGFGIENALKGIVYQKQPFIFNNPPWRNGHDLIEVASCGDVHFSKKCELFLRANLMEEITWRSRYSHPVNMNRKLAKIEIDEEREFSGKKLDPNRSYALRFPVDIERKPLIDYKECLVEIFGIFSEKVVESKKRWDELIKYLEEQGK